MGGRGEGEVSTGEGKGGIERENVPWNSERPAFCVPDLTPDTYICEKRSRTCQ
jgi:hypothetical protein